MSCTVTRRITALSMYHAHFTKYDTPELKSATLALCLSMGHQGRDVIGLIMEPIHQEYLVSQVQQTTTRINGGIARYNHAINQLANFEIYQVTLKFDIPKIPDVITPEFARIYELAVDDAIISMAEECFQIEDALVDLAEIAADIARDEEFERIFG